MVEFAGAWTRTAARTLGNIADRSALLLDTVRENGRDNCQDLATFETNQLPVCLPYACEID